MGRILVGEAAEERGKAHICGAWYVTDFSLECDAKLRAEIIYEFLTNEPSLLESVTVHAVVPGKNIPYYT